MENVCFRNWNLIWVTDFNVDGSKFEIIVNRVGLKWPG